MEPSPTAGEEQVFVSVFALRHAADPPWAYIALAVTFFVIAVQWVEVPVVAAALFLAWLFIESWRMGTATLANTGEPLGDYSLLQPASRWIFAPPLGGVAAGLIFTFAPHGPEMAGVIAGLLALWVTFDSVRSARQPAPAPQPPFHSFGVLTRRDARPAGLVLSTGAHIAFCALPILAAFLATFLTARAPEKPKEKPTILTLLVRPPEPVKQEKKAPPPPNTEKTPSVTPEEQPPPIDPGKLDLSRMTLEFAPDRDQALPSVLSEYSAQVAFVDRASGDAYRKGGAILPADYIYSSANWAPVGHPGDPTDISEMYLLRLQQPERCDAIARLLAALGPAASRMEVYLVFPREAEGFEPRLQRAIQEEAHREAATLHGSIISRVQIAFTLMDPGIAVRHLEAASAPNPN